MQSQCSKEDAVQCSEEEDAKALPTLSYFSGGGLRHCDRQVERSLPSLCSEGNLSEKNHSHRCFKKRKKDPFPRSAAREHAR